MVEFFCFDPSFSSWLPSLEEFQSFTENNKYYKAKASLSSSVITDSVSTSPTTLPPAPVHSYALKMTKRMFSVDHRQQHGSLSFSMEETSTEIERDESKCPICAVELKERLYLLNYQRLMENSKAVRNMCMRKEHPATCHMCIKHRPYEPSEGIPRCAAGDASPRFPYARSLTGQQLPLLSANYQRGPVNMMGQPISVPSYNYHRTPMNLTGQSITTPGSTCEPNRANLIGQQTPNHTQQPVAGINSDQKVSLAKRTPKPETQGDAKSGYKIGLKMGSNSVREPKLFEPDQTSDWFNYYRLPDQYTDRMDYTKSFDKPNEKSENFPSKRMAARFDIDTNVKSDN